MAYDEDHEKFGGTGKEAIVLNYAGFGGFRLLDVREYVESKGFLVNVENKDYIAEAGGINAVDDALNVALCADPFDPSAAAYTEEALVWVCAVLI